MNKMSKAVLFVIMYVTLQTGMSSAFVSSAPCAASIHQKCFNSLNSKALHKRHILMAEKADDSIITNFLSTLPSPETMQENIFGGEFGQRGEQYVIAQFSLFLFIAIGNIPFIGDIVNPIIGPALVLVGFIAVYKASADLDGNLSPWPVPTKAATGKGSLIDTGIYSYVRHPMYTGVLFGMCGLSVITDSVIRMLLTVALYFVLDLKSDYEETKLIEVFGEEYENYRAKVKGKFFPANIANILNLE